MYGGVSGTKAERAYYEFFKEKYSGVAREQERWKQTVAAEKKLVTATGLIFYWPDTRWEGSDRNPYLRNTTSICNFPVQSLATADIIPIAVVKMWELMQLHETESFIVNTIHDSIILEVHPDEVEIITELAEYAFRDGVIQYLKDVYNIEWNVPLEIEAEYGNYWKEK